MKESKAVYVTKRDLSERHYQYYNKAICVNRVNQIPPSAIRNYRVSTTKTNFQNVGCQFDSKKENFTGNCGNIATSRRRFDSVLPKHGHFHASKSYIDIGISSVKTLQRRKVRRTYLPETDDRGVGSSDLTYFIHRRARLWKEESYYGHKKTSSKCVQLSPIFHKKSGTTSPGIPFKAYKNADVGSNTIVKTLVTIATQVEDEIISANPDKRNKKQPNAETKEVKQFKPKNKLFKAPADYTVKTDERGKNTDNCFKDSCKVFSSDSLVQHVHDLEVPSDNKQSVDLVENKLEREYRRTFSMKSKDKEPPSDFKKESALKRNFEALRRGLAKKDDQKRSRVIVKKESSQKSITSLRDVSINSDPSSLQARSYCNTKVYSPIQYFEQAPAVTSKSPYVKKDVNSSDWSRLEDDSECQGVKGMFKLWGKKFNLEEDYCKKLVTPISSFAMPKKAHKTKARKNDEDKKDGKKWFFFKKEHKDKDKAGFKLKKGVTAGRREVKDGLVIKMGTSNYQSKSEVKEYDETFRKTWVDKFLTSDVDSRKSVKVRWNNKTYATSSSTVFELKDYFNRVNGVIFKSRSDIITPESSFYKSYRQQVNFVPREIESRMIPKTIIDNKNITNIKGKEQGNKEITISEQNCVIDKSKAFAQKIKVMLRSENVGKANDNSAACLRIDILRGFFADSSSGEDGKTQYSDEQVYKIVEYETETDFKKQKEAGLETGDYDENEFRFVVSVKDSKNWESKIVDTVIKTPLTYRDAVIQGSDVYIPKRCDVIGVGIITERELSNAWKPILKIQDGPETSDDESEPIMEPKIKKCEFAESYLQDCYRHWIPSGIDFFNWCISDSHLKGSNENSKTSFNTQGDGCKSSPNIYDDFQTSTSNEPCFSCGPCHPLPSMSEDKISKQETKVKSDFFKKRKKDKAKGDDLNKVLHKDSLEVFKKRKIYACSNKSKWGVGFECPEHGSISVPSIQDKEAQDRLTDCPPLNKSCCKTPPVLSVKSKSCKKHVLLPECDTMNEALAKQLARKREGILTCKEAVGCNVYKKDGNAKRASVNSIVSVRKGPDCISDCKNEKHQPCEDLSERCSPTKILLRKSSPSNFDNSKCCIPPSQSQQSLERYVKQHSPALSVPVSPKVKQSPRLKSPRPPISPGTPPCLTPKISQSSDKPCSNRNLQHSQNCPDKLIIKIISHKPPTNCKPSPISPHFPPCIKTQSTQKSPKGSASLTPRPQRQQPVQKVPSTPKKRKKIHEPKKCFTEPCSKIPSNELDKFPWPIKNQEEYDDKLKSPNQCDKKCDLLPPTPPLIILKVDKEKDCKPDCANRLKTRPPDVAQNPVESKPTLQLNINSSKGRITGLHLKMKSAKKKTCSEECIASKAPKELIDDSYIIRLNSNEISLKIKGTSPSTEEIREKQNIKVKDDDGNTLYERIDYKNDCSKPSCAILGDLYKASINRMSTPININNIACGVNKDDFDDKNESSVFNLIEIQFKLKIMKGEKTTVVNIDNEEVNDGYEPDNNSQIYLATHNLCDTNGDSHKSYLYNSKNDVSIRILIKNHKPKGGREYKKYNKDFSKNIASKFQTVSTAYSHDSPRLIGENAFSIHRTTIDLTASADKSKINIKRSNEFLSPQLTDADPINLLKSSQSVCYQYHEENKTNNNNDKNTSDISLEKKAFRSTADFKNEIDRLVDENIDYDELIESSNSIEYLRKPRTRKEKKEMLKKVFEMANESDTKSKENKKELQDMLKFVLTSDSGANEAIAVTSNELATDIINVTLKPKILRNTDSMNNYYHIESPMASYNSKIRMYPTEENSDSLKSESENEGKTCMCSKFAERLKLCNIGGGCCCRSVSTKKDDATNCDLRSKDDFCLLKYKEYVDIDTQHSKFIATKINNTKISMHCDNLSNFNTTEPVAAQVKTSNRLSEEITKIIFKKSFTRKFVNHCPMKKFNQNTILGISDEDKIVIFDSKSKNPERNNKIESNNTEKKGDKDQNIIKPVDFQQAADILQSYETKKAVLEIYAEKTLTDEGKHIVANLPTFVYKNESDIRKFEKVVEKYNGVKKDVLIMSIQS